MMPPKQVAPKRPLLALFFMILFFLMLCLVLSAKAPFNFIFVFGLLVAIAERCYLDWHFSRLDKERTEENIGTFAFALPAWHHDTWVVRAVYEELSSFCQIPVRPNDDLRKTLKLDIDDIAYVLILSAERIGTVTDGMENDKSRTNISTVADMICFMERYPRAA